MLIWWHRGSSIHQGERHCPQKCRECGGLLAHSEALPLRLQKTRSAMRRVGITIWDDSKKLGQGQRWLAHHRQWAPANPGSAAWMTAIAPCLRLYCVVRIAPLCISRVRCTSIDPLIS